MWAKIDIYTQYTYIRFSQWLFQKHFNFGLTELFTYSSFSNRWNGVYENARWGWNKQSYMVWFCCSAREDCGAAKLPGRKLIMTNYWSVGKFYEFHYSFL